MHKGNKRVLTGLLALLLVLMMPVTAGAQSSEQLEAVGTIVDPPVIKAELDLNAVVAGYVTLEIRVVNAAGKALSGAAVALQTRDNATTTNKEGRAWLRELLPGLRYQIYVSKSGYEEWSGIYTCPGDKNGTDTMTVTLTAIPPETTAPNSPGGSTSGGNNGGTGNKPGGSTGNKPGNSTGGTNTTNKPTSPTNPTNPTETTQADGFLEITIPDGGNSVLISRPMLEESSGNNRDILVISPETDGERKTLTIPPLTAHDLDILGNLGFTVNWTGSGFALAITVPKEETERTATGLPHTLVTLMEERSMPLHVLYMDNRSHDLTVTPQTLKRLAKNDADVFFEYDRREAVGSLVIAVQTAAHGPTDSAWIPAEAFALARDAGLSLKCRIYDRDTGGDLWYEWIFTPQQLQAVKAEDVDLYIRAVPNDDDPVRQLTDGVQSQYIITNHEGELPTTALLRVKNQKAFPEEQSMALLWVNGDHLEYVARGLLPEDGWYCWEMEHCSSYVLLEELNLIQVLGRTYEPVETGNWYWLLLLAAGVLMIFLLILLGRYTRVKRKSSDGVDRNLEVVKDDGRH